MTSSPQNPLENIYAAREELDRALGAHGRIDIAQSDWPAYGSALLGVLSSLRTLTDAVDDQVDRTDRERLYREALRDHPHEALDNAVAHLDGMSQVLSEAMAKADHYWAETQRIDEDTKRD